MAKLASRYSLALFNLAKEKNALKAYYNSVSALKSAFAEEEIKAFILSPKLSGEDKFAALEKTLEGKIEPDIMGFLSVVFTKNREKELTSIFDAFLDKVLEEEGIVTAYVESAYPLKETQLEEIRTKLSKNLNKQIVIKTSVDKTLLGGVKITADGHVIDGTLKKGIDDLKKTLLENRLA